MIYIYINVYAIYVYMYRFLLIPTPWHDVHINFCNYQTKKAPAVLRLCQEVERKLSSHLTSTFGSGTDGSSGIARTTDAQEECSWSSDSSGRREGQINLSQPKKSIKILISYNSNFDLSQDFLRFKGLRGWEFWRRADGVEAIDPSRWYKCWIMLEYEV